MKTQMIFQKIVVWLALFVAVLFFVYSLGFMTNIYRSLYWVSGQINSKTGLPGTPLYKGGNLYYEAQPTNKLLLTCSMIGILAAVFLMITRTGIRRKYYITNYISTILVSLTFVVVSIIGMIKILPIRYSYVNEVDWVGIEAYFDEPLGRVLNISTSIFDIFIVIAIIAVAVSAMLIFNLFWKRKLMEKEERMLSSDYKEEI